MAKRKKQSPEQPYWLQKWAKTQIDEAVKQAEKFRGKPQKRARYMLMVLQFMVFQKHHIWPAGCSSEGTHIETVPRSHHAIAYRTRANQRVQVAVGFDCQYRLELQTSTGVDVLPCKNSRDALELFGRIY